MNTTLKKGMVSGLAPISSPYWQYFTQNGKKYGLSFGFGQLRPSPANFNYLKVFRREAAQLEDSDDRSTCFMVVAQITDPKVEEERLFLTLRLPGFLNQAVKVEIPPQQVLQGHFGIEVEVRMEALDKVVVG